MTDRGKRMHQFFLDLQSRITDALSGADGPGVFRSDAWERPQGGGGRSMVLADGRHLEKCAVHTSCVFGAMPPGFGQDMPGSGPNFFATGISLIAHPKTAHAPTVHMNFRYLEKGDAAWFGGGADLTPWVLYDEDAIHFHSTWKTALDRHDVLPFAKAKKDCDQYFFLPHRGETRGIGGIFFDYLGVSGDLEAIEKMVIDCGASFLDAYMPILDRRKHQVSTEDERTWQLHRRGRYVEFNLLYDRGTIFGLKTHGRVESILASLPNLVAWSYGHEAKPGSEEARLVDVLKSPRDWI